MKKLIISAIVMALIVQCTHIKLLEAGYPPCAISQLRPSSEANSAAGITIAADLKGDFGKAVFSREDLVHITSTVRRWVFEPGNPIKEYKCNGMEFVLSLAIKGSRVVWSDEKFQTWVEIGEGQDGWLIDAWPQIAPGEIRNNIGQWLSEDVAVIPLPEARRIYGKGKIYRPTTFLWIETVRHLLKATSHKDDYEFCMRAKGIFILKAKDIMGKALREKLSLTAAEAAIAKSSSSGDAEGGMPKSSQEKYIFWKGRFAEAIEQLNKNLAKEARLQIRLWLEVTGPMFAEALDDIGIDGDDIILHIGPYANFALGPFCAMKAKEVLVVDPAFRSLENLCMNFFMDMRSTCRFFAAVLGLDVFSYGERVKMIPKKVQDIEELKDKSLKVIFLMNIIDAPSVMPLDARRICDYVFRKIMPGGSLFFSVERKDDNFSVLKNAADEAGMILEEVKYDGFVDFRRFIVREKTASEDALKETYKRLLSIDMSA
jgi:hypothetical protein